MLTFSYPNVSTHVLGAQKNHLMSLFVRLFVCLFVCFMGESRGGHGIRTPPPLKNHKKYRDSCNTGPDPLKNHKATKPAFNVGPSSARQ